MSNPQFEYEKLSQSTLASLCYSKDLKLSQFAAANERAEKLREAAEHAARFLESHATDSRQSWMMHEAQSLRAAIAYANNELRDLAK
jgi:hypothetical protein